MSWYRVHNPAVVRRVAQLFEERKEELANDSDFGLGGSVFSTDPARAVSLAPAASLATFSVERHQGNNMGGIVQDWSDLVGRSVQLWKSGNLIRCGYVEDVASAFDALWLSGEGVEPRAIYARADGYYAVVTVDAAGGKSDQRW